MQDFLETHLADKNIGVISLFFLKRETIALVIVLSVYKLNIQPNSFKSHPLLL